MDEKKVLYVVDKIADKLAVPSKEIINAYAASGVERLIPTIGCFILFMICLIIFIASIYYYDRKPDSQEVLMPISVTSFAVGSVSFVFFFGNLGTMLLWFMNPKAYAIVTLMEKLLK